MLGNKTNEKQLMLDDKVEIYCCANAVIYDHSCSCVFVLVIPSKSLSVWLPCVYARVDWMIAYRLCVGVCCVDWFTRCRHVKQRPEPHLSTVHRKGSKLY